MYLLKKGQNYKMYYLFNHIKAFDHEKNICKNFLSFSWCLATGSNDKMRNGLKVMVMSTIDWYVKNPIKSFQMFTFYYILIDMFFFQANQIKKYRCKI